MEKVNKSPASMDIKQIEKYILQLEGIVKDIEASKELPHEITQTLLLYLTPICGYETRKYKSMCEKISKIKREYIVEQNNITGIKKANDNKTYMCKQYVNIINDLINYTKKKVNKLKKDCKL